MTLSYQATENNHTCQLHRRGGRQALDFGPSLPLHLCIPAPGSLLGSGINQMEQGLKVARSVTQAEKQWGT